MKAEGRSEVLDGLVASGRLQPADAELLRHELGEAEKRGFARAGAILSWTAAGIAAVLWTVQVPVIRFYMQVARIKEMFEGMNLGELPRPTQLLVSVPLWVYVTFFLALAVSLVVKELLIRNKSVTLTLNVAAICAALAYTAFVKWALFAPMAMLMEKLGQEGGGGL
jgi:hypothetical protein